MPRIEIVSVDFDRTTGDGTPTVDVYRGCADKFFVKDGGPVPRFLQEKYPQGRVGSMDVEHPPYSDVDYLCCCRHWLNDKDN